jgi:hypothetical protein
MATAVPSTAPVVPLRAAREPRRFYAGLSLAMAATVLAGFGPTYYGRLLQDGPSLTFGGAPFTPLVHLHGALFTAWVLLFVAQAALVATGRTSVHRRLGAVGGVLAAAMVMVGVRTAAASAARGSAPPGMDPLVFLAIPVFDMVLFVGFVGAALLQRKQPEAHKRLMVAAYASIIVAAVARLPGVAALGPPAFFGLALLFMVAGAVHDRVSRGRVHPAYKWAMLVFVISVPLRLGLSGTAAWRAFAVWLTTTV